MMRSRVESQERLRTHHLILSNPPYA